MFAGLDRARVTLCVTINGRMKFVVEFVHREGEFLIGFRAFFLRFELILPPFSNEKSLTHLVERLLRLIHKVWPVVCPGDTVSRLAVNVL